MIKNKQKKNNQKSKMSYKHLKQEKKQKKEHLN